MKKVEKIKAGMEVWMKFRVEENNHVDYPFKVPSLGVLTEDCRHFKDETPLEMFTIDENEIPELKGVLMEVSDDGVKWHKKKIFGKYYGFFIGYSDNYEYGRPISKTFDLTNVPEHLLTDELKQYLR